MRTNYFWTRTFKKRPIFLTFPFSKAVVLCSSTEKNRSFCPCKKSFITSYSHSILLWTSKTTKICQVTKLSQLGKPTLLFCKLACPPTNSVPWKRPAPWTMCVKLEPFLCLGSALWTHICLAHVHLKQILLFLTRSFQSFEFCNISWEPWRAWRWQGCCLLFLESRSSQAVGN